MNKEETYSAVEIMGKTYQIKCSTDELASLQMAAAYLEDKIYQVRENGNTLSLEKMAVITALNVVHEFLNIEKIMDGRNQVVQQRIQALYHKVDSALEQHRSVELTSEQHRSVELGSEQHRSAELTSEQQRSVELGSEQHRSAELTSEQHRSAELTSEQQRSPALSSEQHRSREQASAE